MHRHRAAGELGSALGAAGCSLICRGEGRPIRPDEFVRQRHRADWHGDPALVAGAPAATIGFVSRFRVPLGGRRTDVESEFPARGVID